ncbi:MAG TPA: Uma2 family endonuclease [Methylomirabilota bacterium]|nr:Uma2 family endonuclease [Methylomirabilota bacterium]
MTKTALTYRDYEALPDDGRRYEIHDGELWVTPAPSLAHQIISGRLYVHLARWVEAHPGGLLLYAPLDVILADRPDETSIVQPDLVYLAPDRLERARPRGIEGGPTLAIEILSPSTSTVDRGTKRRLYARYGVQCLWLIDPDARTLEGFVLERGRYLLEVTATGPTPVDLPPFTGLALVPDTLWP